jgi:hypothetical protein
LKPIAARYAKGGADIKLNGRVSLPPTGRVAIVIALDIAPIRTHREKPPGDHIPLGGFLVIKVSRAMFDDTDHQGERAVERRSIGRTKILKGALLFLSDKTGVHPCTVRAALVDVFSLKHPFDERPKYPA